MPLWKNPSFAEGGICPRRADAFVSLIFRFLGQETFDPKTLKCGTCGKCGFKYESGDFS